MENKLLIKLKFLIISFLVTLVFFSNYVANFAVDWENPKCKTIQRSEEEFKKEHEQWLKEKKEAEEKGVEFKKEPVSKVKYEVTWDIDDADDSVWFLLRKIGIPVPKFGFPLIQLVCWVAYIFLFTFVILTFYIKNLYHYHNQYAALYAPALYQSPFIIAYTTIAKIIKSMVMPNLNTADKDLIEFANNAFKGKFDSGIDDAFEMLFILFCVNFFILLALELLGEKKVRKMMSRVTNSMKNLLFNLVKILLFLFLGTKLRIKRSGKAVIRRFHLDRTKKGFPKVKYKKYKLSLPELLFYMRKTLLSGVSKKIFSDLREDLVRQLGDLLYQKNREQRDYFELNRVPEGMRFMVKRGDVTAVVIENKPGVHKVRFEESLLVKERWILKEENRYDEFPEELLKTNEFELSFPYCVFVLFFRKDKFERMYAFWTTKKLTGLRDGIYQFGLPNITGSGDVCLGVQDYSNTTIVDACESIIQTFWGSTFTGHLLNAFKKIKDIDRGRLRTVYDWHVATKEDPEFMSRVGSWNWVHEETDIKFTSYGNVLEVINDFCKREKDKSRYKFHDAVDDMLLSRPISSNVLDDRKIAPITTEQIFEIIEKEEGK